MLPIKIRTIEKGDSPFIFDSWSRSYRDSKRIWNKEFYFKELERRLHKLKQNGCDWLIACDETEADYMVGWLAAKAPICHYLFVKRAFRGNGVAKALLKEAGFNGTAYCTHWTGYSSSIAKKHNLINIDL